MTKEETEECGRKCEVYSRVVGYYRPVQNWNVGKREEFKDRLEYTEAKALAKDLAKCECESKK